MTRPQEANQLKNKGGAGRQVQLTELNLDLPVSSAMQAAIDALRAPQSKEVNRQVDGINKLRKAA